MTTALDLIDQWAGATRGYWGDFDGNIAEATITDLTSTARDVPGPLPEEVVVEIRDDLYMCLSGGHHWQDDDLCALVCRAKD